MAKWAALLCVMAFLALAVSSEGYLGPDRLMLTVKMAIGARGFRLGAWEAQAIEQKVQDAIARPGESLSPTQQHDLVRAYFDGIAESGRLTGKIRGIYADPKQKNATAATATLQEELESLRREQAQRRPAVERILQRQVSATLFDAGLLTAGKVWPPVLFQFTESPDVLIISPRDRISFQYSTFVSPGEPVAVMEQIEDQVEKQPNVSALVDGTGGFSAYPTMVIPVSDLSWVADTIAHEWTHTYLAFRPLGWHYFDNGETRTLNETVASIVGNEVGQTVIERYYPELIPEPATPRPSEDDSSVRGRPARPQFDYAATMRTTRLHVDDLLAKGRIAEAEAYMEEQRRVFVANGYNLRKLNQAFFAFHGSYAVGPAATDPIGGKLRALRQQSASLLAFVNRVAGIRSVQDLDAMLAKSRTGARRGTSALAVSALR